MKNITADSLRSIILIAITIVAAIMVGNGVVEQDYKIVIAILALFSFVILFIHIRNRIYYFIPICWGLTGKISILPLPFDFHQLVILISIGYLIAEYIFHHHSLTKYHPEIIDYLLWINVIYVLSVLIRNPVSVGAIDFGDRVGGKPYLDSLLALSAYFILSRLRISTTFAKNLPKWILWAALFSAFAGAVGVYLPSLGSKIAPFYSDFGPAGYIIGTMGEESSLTLGADRLVFGGYVGTIICLYVLAKITPKHLIRPENWGLFLQYLFGCFLVLLSGFREAFLTIIMSTFSAAFLRERFIGVFKVLFILVLFATGGVLLTFLPLKIPFTFQRTLSFLPGNWDQEAVLDAKGSTEWRLDMWKEVITSDRYIHNKILGDGFGLPRTDYEAQLSSLMTGVNAYEGKLAAQESFMINGDFHSGPLSLVRFVGVVGGALFLTLLFMMASYSYKLIEKSHGTPFEFCTLFVCIPLFVEPIFYLFIFGDFKAELPSTLYNIGFMNMISASITMYKNKEQKLKNNN